MADKQLVSVISPVWGRPEELVPLVHRVREQTYRPLQHVVVVDGPMTPEYERGYLEILREGPSSSLSGGYHLQFETLGWRPTEELPDSFAVGALITGCLKARGELQTWWCDDEEATTDHLEALVDLLLEQDVDFVYPRVRVWRPEHDWALEVGEKKPMLGTVTVALYRRACLKYGMYRFLMPHKTTATNPVPHDWDLFSEWVANGARWAFLNRTTFSHRADH